MQDSTNLLEQSMGSASDDIQNQMEDARSEATSLITNHFPLAVGGQSPTDVLHKDQIISGDDYAIKVRKQYTITKQRERWTEEEHNKFLEALKLYGRAWRRIEEHVGTKTAVQIRSHAQKFFSKVVRETSSNEEGMVKTVEIPPPRPKRKPMHPYPRKMVGPIKTGAQLSDESTRSLSRGLSVSGQESQSPTSVLSAIGSDTTCVTAANMLNCNLSPDSSDEDDQPIGLFTSEAIPSAEENESENGSSSPAQENDSSTQDVHVPMKLELFPDDGAFPKEGSDEDTATQSLKLFGKTVIVNRSSPSDSKNNHCSSSLLEVTDERSVETSSWNLTPGMRISPSDAECAWTGSSYGPSTLYYVQFAKENSNNLKEVGSTTPFPCWTLYGGVSYPFLQLHNTVPEQDNACSDESGVQDKKVQKNESRTGSNSGSVNAGLDGDKTWDVETQSRQPGFDKKENENQQGTVPAKAMYKRGFMPYKRCLSERDNGSTITCEESEERRIRLCL